MSPSPPSQTSDPLGFVLGTQEATPLAFWVAVSPGYVACLDDVIRVSTQRPDDGTPVEFYGIVDFVRTQYEGTQFDTDTFLATEGKMPVNISYVAHVQVTRIEPESYFPPQPGDRAYLAKGTDLDTALYFDSMDAPIPAGVMSNGNPAYLNFSFINGEKAAHVNISGISGVATKTSYALFLLYAIFNAKVLGTHRANTKALIFNVKGEDLFFLDKLNKRYARVANEGGNKGDRRDKDYSIMGLPVTPFQSARFCATPRKYRQLVEPDLEQRSQGVSVYLWSVRELCRDRLFRFLFTGRDLEQGNLAYLVATVEERLARVAEDNDRKDFPNPPQAHLTVDPYGEDNQTQIADFTQLIQFLEDKLLKFPDTQWMGRNTGATAEAMIRRLYGIRSEVQHLIRGDLSPEEVASHQLDPLAGDAQLTVADIHKLGARAQQFVVGVLLQKLFARKETQGREPVVFIVLDELNKYAPREGRSPIKELLVDIAERGRSLGIILIGAQQTASEVERRVVGQAAIRVVGRLDSAEAERPEYNFLPASCRQRSLFLKSGKMFVHQPEVPAPIMIQFPFPAYATRKDEVAISQEEVAQIEADLERF